MSIKEGDLNGELRGHKGPGYPTDAISALFFWPVGYFMPMSYRRRITHEDTYKLRTSNSSEESWKLFEPIWKAQLAKPKPSLIRALLLTFWKDLAMVMLTWLSWSGLQYTNPLILPYLSQYFVYPTLPAWWGYIYMTAMWSSSFMSIVLFNATLYRTWTVGSRVRSVLINLIYRKSINVTPAALGSRGTVLNLMSTDAQIILDTFPQFVMGLASPVQIGVTIGLLAREIGVFCLIPLGILLLGFPILATIGKRLPMARLRVQRAADVRVKLTTEFISAIRIVKYYAWERPFLAKVDEAREAEIVHLRRIATYNCILLGSLVALPTLAMGWTIFFYAIGHNLALGSIFSAISYLAYLRFPFVFMPLAFTFGAQYAVSLERIRQFCLNQDIEEGSQAPDADPKRVGGMKLSKASFTWEYDRSKIASANVVLEDISLKVPKGHLVMVVGGVGSGKSSLASAFLKELQVLKGKVWVSSPIGYASQEPFLINTTIRDNITFGQKYDPLWYQQVINACALVTDLELFPAGDLTEIAEKGSNLSGGQRQRVNVARAMYSNRELYVFDDPFSAVDAHVGDHMFKNVCLPLRDMERGILLITNQLQFLPYADSIAVLKGGKIVESGSYQDLIQKKNELYALAIEYGLIQDEKMKAELNLSSSANLSRSAALRGSADSSKKEPLGEDANLKVINLTPEEIEARDAKNRQLGALITKESSQNKAVAHAVYVFFFSAGGIILFTLACVFNLLRTGFNVGESVWLSRWANPQHTNQFSKATHMGAYIALVFGEVISILCFVTIMVKFTVNSSRRIHRKLLGNVAHATTGFFDKTPLGRLLSRFSKDMSLIDTLLPLQLQQAMNLGFLVLGVIVNVAIGSKYAVIIIIVAIAYFVIMLMFYRRTSIQVQRLEAVSRAPIFTHFGETLEGLPTVRAYNMSYNFVIAIMNKVDYNANDFLTLRRLTQWFNMATNQIVNLIVTGIFLMFILFRNYSPESYDVSLAVSACANSVTLISILGAFAFLFSEFEARMNAPERVLEYNNVEQEKAYEIEETRPEPEWPSQGKIEFDKLTIAYKPGVPVLHALSATIEPMEKIGIVGRTGAGKSTLITALFRTTEPVSGSVKIDGIDIDTIGLFDLRRRLSIIPQVPQLFMGTVRYNLDPFGAHQDERIWEVLDMVHLKEFIQSLSGGLSANVDENGGNFSVGQRQLISMARCLLLDSHILLLDEATASLDVQSDAMLQKMIRKHFVKRTVLTIAHRLITIIDCDRVLVLDAGKIVEFDSPKTLLQNKEGAFYSMVHATGKATAAHLTAIANGKLRVADVLEEDPDILEESSIEEIVHKTTRRKKSKKKTKKFKRIVEEEEEDESS